MPDKLLPRISRIERAVLNIENMICTLVEINANRETIVALLKIVAILKEQACPTPQEVWLDSVDVRNQYKISRSTLYRWKRDKVLTPASAIGKKDMYKRSDIEKLLRKPPGESK